MDKSVWGEKSWRATGNGGGGEGNKNEMVKRKARTRDTNTMKNQAKSNTMLKKGAKNAFTLQREIRGLEIRSCIVW